MVNTTQNRTFKQQVLRIRWIDYVRIKHIFPAEKNESAAKYFERLAKWLQGLAGLYLK